MRILAFLLFSFLLPVHLNAQTIPLLGAGKGAATAASCPDSAQIDLNFAAGTVCGAAAFTDVVSVARTSNGYARTSSGMLTSFGNNILRITDLGLLIEESRTNLTTRSQEFDVTWSQNNLAVTANQTNAPDGTLTADLITLNAANNSHFLSNPPTVSNALPYTGSFYVKPGTQTLFQLTMNSAAFGAGQWANFTLTGAGTVNSQTGGTATVLALANGWYRITFTVTSTAAAAGGIVLATIANAADGRLPIYAPAGTETFHAWGGQTEQGGFATTYIPTTTTSATRQNDNVTPAGALATAFLATPASALVLIAGGANNATAARVFDWNGSSPNWAAAIGTGNTSVLSSPSITATFGSGTAATQQKVALSWGSGTSIVANDGTVTTNVGTLSPSAGTLTIGNNASLARGLNTYIQRIATWSSRLSDPALKALTVP